MDSKLTLKLKNNIIEKAKLYAKKQNTSLSRLIENYLKTVTVTDEKEGIKITPLVLSLTGVIELEESNYKKRYTDYLSEKYT
ncbi:MAG: DUF6364 family protein [Flavobacteriaceae bacterium]|nr:DUF6364 family protein [Flavobacteriaceae bacterium]